jgi:hypothetical protein
LYVRVCYVKLHVVFWTVYVVCCRLYIVRYATFRVVYFRVVHVCCVHCMFSASGKGCVLIINQSITSQCSTDLSCTYYYVN